MNGTSVDEQSDSQHALQSRALAAAARLLAAHRYEEVDLEQIAETAGLSLDELVSVFPTMHAAGAAVLTAEGNSMRQAMARARESSTDPLETLQRTFELIGQNMAELIVVRGGMRLAAEARQFFPERRIDPYRTWYAFVVDQLESARAQQLLRADIDIEAVTWLIVSAGMGTKDLVAFRDAWDEVADRLNATLSTVLQLVRVPSSP